MMKNSASVFSSLKMICAVSVLAVAVGCGSKASGTASSSGAAAAMPQAGVASGPGQLRNKLNAMTVQERIAYLKSHKGAGMGMAGGSAPMMAQRPGGQ